MKDKFLVLGSNSFSGSNFINFILKKKHKVIGVSRSREINKAYLIYKKNKFIKNFKFKKIDLNKDINKLIKLILKFKPSIIVNYAAQGMVSQSWENPEHWYMTNVVSQSIFYKKVSKFKFIKKLIHVTTPEVYGSSLKTIKENYNFNPSTPYAISRAALDTHLYKCYLNFRLPIIFTRTSNIYGPGQQLYRIIPKAFMSFKKSIKLNLHGGGKSLRSFIFADDASEATYLISKKGKLGETYHISDNKFITIKDLTKKISIMEKLSFSKSVRIEKDRVGKDHAYKLYSKKIKDLKWTPKINLNRGLFLTQKWIESNFNIFKNSNLNYVHKK